MTLAVQQSIGGLTELSIDRIEERGIVTCPGQDAPSRGKNFGLSTQDETGTRGAAAMLASSLSTSYPASFSHCS
jgi:hypothetical protein